jgi:hypothetical protein
MGMATTDPGMRLWQHRANHNITIDRLSTRGYSITR